MKKNLFFIIILTTVLISSCAKEGLEKKTYTLVRNDGSSITLELELAKTTEERNRGYMEREHIPEGTGMLFIFERDQILNFWMKNTPSPLSIAYIDSRGVIRDIYDMTPHSLEGVQSRSSCRYALEVPQGWFSANNIVPGCKLILN